MQLAVTRAEQASSLIEILSVYLQDTWRPTPRLAVTYGLRWQITPPPSTRQAVPPTVTIQPAVTPDRGVAPPATSTPVPAAPAASGPLWPTRYGQIAPRISAAYGVTRRAVVRGGWGIFYDLGFSAATDPINGFPFNRWQFGDTVIGVLGPVKPVGSTYATNLALPYSHEWNLVWEQALTSSDAISAGYAGSAGRHLLRREAGIQTNGRPGLTIATNHGASDYHALEVAYRRRLSRGVEAIGNYTWSHALDNGSWDSGVALVLPDYPAARDRASSSFDVRHAFSTAVTFESQGVGRTGALRRLTSGWKLQAIARARSGFPVDVLETENSFGFGWDNYRRPDVVPGVTLWIDDPSVPGGRRWNPAAFRASAGSQGALGRNAF